MPGFDTKFSPYVSAITKPTGKNAIKVAANGALDYFQMREIKMEEKCKRGG